METLFLLNTEKLMAWKRHKQFPQWQSDFWNEADRGWLVGLCAGQSMTALRWTCPAGMIMPGGSRADSLL